MELAPIRVASNGHNFETIDGQPFLFLGFNDAITWPGLAGLYRGRDFDAVEAYLDNAARHGVTILRVMLEYVHREGRYFEGKGGRFNPAMVRLWDDFIERCEQYKLRLLLTPFDSFWMSRRWHKHPYNIANGGVATKPSALFEDDATINVVIRRFQFVIERWGKSGVIAAWDLFNEIHPYWGGDVQRQISVISRLSHAVREAEETRWGFVRPQTVSIFGPNPDESYQSLIFRHPDLDFATTHIYNGAIDFPKDTVTSAVEMANWVCYARRLVTPGRPFTDTEHGPIHLFNDHRKMLSETFDDEYERHLMWAHFASGGAGSGMRWPARHPHLVTNGTLRALENLSQFTKQVSWERFRPNADVQLKVEPGTVAAAYCADQTQAIAWLVRRPPENYRGQLPPDDPLTDVQVTLFGFRPGSATVRIWHTQRPNSELVPVQADERGVIVFRLPVLVTDVALFVRADRL